MTEPFVHENESFLHIEKWQRLNPKLRVGFTTRNGGVSKEPFHALNLGLHVPDDKQDVVKNRQHLAKELEMPLEDWVSGEQIHATNVVVVDEDDKGKGSVSYADSLKGVDGLITNRPGILCTAFYADCVPLFFFDPSSNYIGIAHAGWKGTVNRIAEKMVTKLGELNVDKTKLLVAIGPSISQQAYEVDEHVMGHIPVDLRDKVAILNKNNHFLLDLKQLNMEILLQCGIMRHNIDITNFCTFHDESLFFSHRRDNGKTGRMLGFIGFIK